MSQFADLSGQPSLDEPGLLELEKKLCSMGVAVAFWGEHGERLTASEVPVDLRFECWLSEDGRKMVETIRGYAELWAQEIAEAAKQSEVPDAGLLATEIGEKLLGSSMEGDLLVRSLILAGDKMTEAGATDRAASLYSLAIEHAPTPPAQLEVGFLLALRADVQFPVPVDFWREYYGGPIVLTRSHYFEGLDHYEVIYDALEKGPRFPEPWRLLRLALEAYGRVFAYLLREADVTTAKGVLNEDTWLGMLIIDGLNVLFSALDQEDLDLMLRTCYEWEELKGWNVPAVVEMRLQAHDAYLKGREAGRDVERAVQQAIEVTARTEVVNDPDSFAQAVADTVISRLRPPVEKTERHFRKALESAIGAKWASLPERIQQQLVLAEYASTYGESDAGRLGAILIYGNAVEGLVRLRLGAQKTTLGEAARDLKSGRIKLGANRDVSKLGSSLEKLAALRNRLSHGDSGWEPPSPEHVKFVRDLVVGGGRILMSLAAGLPDPGSRRHDGTTS